MSYFVIKVVGTFLVDVEFWSASFKHFKLVAIEEPFISFFKELIFRSLEDRTSEMEGMNSRMSFVC